MSEGQRGKSVMLLLHLLGRPDFSDGADRDDLEKFIEGKWQVFGDNAGPGRTNLQAMIVATDDVEERIRREYPIIPDADRRQGSRMLPRQRDTHELQAGSPGEVVATVENEEPSTVEGHEASMTLAEANEFTEWLSDQIPPGYVQRPGESLYGLMERYIHDATRVARAAVEYFGAAGSQQASGSYVYGDLWDSAMRFRDAASEAGRVATEPVE